MLDMTRPQTLVSLRGVSKTYANGTVALAEVDLDIRGGEVLTLLGPSGCGKSTILRLIAGLDVASSGVLTRAFDNVGAAVGFVFQEPTLMPWASAFDNVFLPLRLLGKAAAPPRRRSRRRSALSDLPISPRPFHANFPAACACAFRSRARWCCARRYS